MDDQITFNMYIRIATYFAIKLTDERDRSIAAKWIMLIESKTDENEKSIRIHVIQLLILCLLRKCMVGPFEKWPNDETSLLQFTCIQPQNISEKILEKEYNKNGERNIYVEISGDLCEYVAVQEIPKFGHHFYYAYSPESIKKWINLDKDLIPKGLLNVTVISSPDNSILAEAIRCTQKKKKEAIDDDDDEDILNCNKGTYDKATILDRDGSIEKQFLVELPDAKILNEKEIKKLVKRGIIVPDELDVDNAIIEDGTEVHGPYIENVSISKNNQIFVQKTKVKHSQQENLEPDIQSNQIGEARKEILAKIPPRIRERLSKINIKEIEAEEEENTSASDIFDENVNRRQQKCFEPQKKKWKIEEFGLSPSEQFRPAHHVIDALIKEQNLGVLSESTHRSVDEVEESFERSWQKYQKETQKPFGPEPLSCRRAALLKKLQCLKKQQTKKIVFDDLDICIEPEEKQFEKFVYSEFPDDPADVTILDNMPTDDMFGPDQIADIQALPQPKAFCELEKANILLDAEMIFDDIFGEDQIENPKLAFKEVVIEGERDYGCTSGSYRVGKRIVAIPGEEPVSQAYIEQTGNEALYDDTLLGDYTPQMNDSMINNIADQKLIKLLGGIQQSPRLYGPWATRFQDYIDRMEKGESNLEENCEDETLNTSQMENADIFGQTSTPSPVFRNEKIERQTQKFETIKKQMAERKIMKRLYDSNQDLLEPYMYETFYEPPGLLDASIQEQQHQTPLIKALHIKPRTDPFASFEKKLDESLQIYENEPLPSSKPKIFLDSDFLNRKIRNEQIPVDNSILDSDEMVDNFQPSQIGEPQNMIIPKIKVSPAFTQRTPQPVLSHLYISNKYTIPCETPGVLTEAYMDQEVSGFEDFLLPPEGNELPESVQILEPNEIYTPDMCGQDAIRSPSRAEFQSPACIALMKSIEQTKRFRKLYKKFRAKRGLLQQASPQHEEKVCDKALPAKYSPTNNPTLLDANYNRTSLHAPLTKSPVPPALVDPYASFEQKMNKSLKPKDHSFGNSFIKEGELSGQFENCMIADPAEFQNVEVPEYPQVNKFLLSGIGEEIIDDISCPNYTLSETPDRTIWTEDMEKKYNELLKHAQKQLPPKKECSSNLKLVDSYTSGSKTAVEQTLESLENTDCSDDKEKISPTTIAYAVELTKKMNRLQQKYRAFQDFQNKPKINIATELLPNDQISAVTERSLLYETPNASVCPVSYTKPSSCKPCIPVSQCTKSLHRSPTSKIPFPCKASPSCKNQNSQRRSFDRKLHQDHFLQLPTDNFLENEYMPHYNSPVQAKERNISFYANQVDLRQIQEEEMPSFDSPIPKFHSTMHENFDTSLAIHNDSEPTSFNYMRAFEVKKDENDKALHEITKASSSSLMLSAYSGEPYNHKLDQLKRRYASWKDSQNLINNIPPEEACPFFMKTEFQSPFYESAPLSPNTPASQQRRSRRVFADKTNAEKKFHVNARRIELQENIETEQIPIYESPPQAKPVRLPVFSNLSDDIFKEDMPEYESPLKLHPIRKITGELEDFEEGSHITIKGLSPAYTLAPSKSDVFSTPFESPASRKVPSFSKDLKQKSLLYKSREARTSKGPRTPPSPLVQQPVPFSPVCWGSFDKKPQFNFSPSQLTAESLHNVSRPRFMDFSPLKFPLPKIETKNSLLDDEEFPLVDLSSEEERQREIAQLNKRQIQSPIMPDRSTKMSPVQSQLPSIPKLMLGEEQFKWIGDLVGYEQQIQRTPKKCIARKSRIPSKIVQMRDSKSRAPVQQPSHCKAGIQRLDTSHSFHTNVVTSSTKMVQLQARQPETSEIVESYRAKVRELLGAPKKTNLENATAKNAPTQNAKNKARRQSCKEQYPKPMKPRLKERSKIN